MGGREEGGEGRKERRKGSLLLRSILAPIVSSCSNYQIHIILAISCFLLAASEDHKTHKDRLLVHLVYYELPKCFSKYLACGRPYIAHLLRITYLCCLFLRQQLLYFYRDTTARHPAERFCYYTKKCKHR